MLAASSYLLKFHFAYWYSATAEIWFSLRWYKQKRYMTCPLVLSFHYITRRWREHGLRHILCCTRRSYSPFYRTASHHQIIFCKCAPSYSLTAQKQFHFYRLGYPPIGWRGHSFHILHFICQYIIAMPRTITPVDKFECRQSSTLPFTLQSAASSWCPIGLSYGQCQILF